MNTQSVNTKFNADVSGFTGPVTKAIASMEAMIKQLEKLGAAGNQQMARIAQSARQGLDAFTYAHWQNPMGAGGASSNPAYWRNWTYHAEAARKKAVQIQQQREDEFARKEQQKRQREAERQRAQTMRTVGRVGMSGVAGAAAGFLSGNPLRGAMSGAITGAFVGGPVGALVGGATGLLGGTLGMGVDVLKAGLSAAVDLTRQLVVETAKLGSEYQKNLALFQAFTGDRAGAQRVMSGLEDIATASPFKFRDLIGPATLLMGYGVPAGEVEGTVGRLSKAALGNPEWLQRLSLAYAQVRSLGRFQGQELRQFANVGIGAPDFAETMGVSNADFLSMMRKGQVTDDVVRKTINRLTDPGGRYSEVNDQLLRGVEGRLNQLIETAQIKLGRLGMGLFEKLGVGDKIAGVTDSLGPFLDQWVPRIEEGLTNIFNIGGRALQPLIENVKTLIEFGKEMWAGPWGKMFLPQTWQEFETGVLKTGFAVSMLAGMVMDAGRAFDVGAAYARSFMRARVGDFGGSAAEAANAQLAWDDLKADPARFSTKMTMPWVKAMMERAAGRGPWSWMASGGGGGAGGLPAIPTSTPLAGWPADLKKFATEVQHDYSDGGASAFGKFKEAVDKIDRISKPRVTYQESTNPFTGVKQFIPTVLNPLIDQGEADSARYAAFLKLKSQFGGTSADSFRLPSGAMADTTEALQVALESSFTQPVLSVQEQIRDVLEKAKAAEDAQLNELKELNRQLKEGGVILKQKKV